MSDDLQAYEHALEVSILQDSLLDMSIALWPLVTGVPLRRNIIIDGVIDTLQAVADGHLRRTIIEVPFGCGKSTETAGIYKPWRLARNPAHRSIHGSHSFDLAARDSRRSRRVVESDWYRSRFPHVRLRDDENTVQRWATTADGSYAAVGVGGSLTGHRAHEIIVDDAINAIDMHSKAKRDEVFVWFTEALLTRIDGDGPVTLVGQRLGVDDLAGRLRDTGAWNIVTIPAEYDPRRRCFLFGIDGREIWKDPRTEEGELGAPDVLGAEKIAELKATIGTAAAEAQLNQNPSSDETSMCPARWWRFYRAPHAPTGIRRPAGCDDAPAVLLPDRFDHVVIGGDLSYGGSIKADPSVVQAWGAKGGARYLLRHWRQRTGGIDAQLAAIDAMKAEFPQATIVLEKAANGQAVADTLKKKYPAVLLLAPVGGKAQRLASQVPSIEAGSCYLPEHANYLADVIEEFRTFPGKTDDIVDCAVWCLYALANRVRPPAYIHGGLSDIGGLYDGPREYVGDDGTRYVRPRR